MSHLSFILWKKYFEFLNEAKLLHDMIKIIFRKYVKYSVQGFGYTPQVPSLTGTRNASQEKFSYRQ